MATWIRMRDTVTGHHFDADARRVARLVAAGAAEVVDGYPHHDGAEARRPKPQRPLRALTPAPAEPAEDAAPEHPEEEA